jgi:hypothetical protein
MNVQINERYPLANALDWEIEQYHIFDRNGEPIKGYKQIINNYTGEVLNVAKKTYTPVSNERLQEVVSNFMYQTGFDLEGYAFFNGGKKVLAYLKDTKPRELAGQKAQDYLIIGNSHDGSTSFFTGFTNRIYRCENMFSQTNQQNRIRHTANSNSEIQALENTIQLYYNEVTGVYEIAEKMAERATTQKDQRAFLNAVLNIEDPQQLSTRKNNQIEAIENAIFEETTALGNNLFGLFNGITNYTSNIMKQKSPVFGNPFNLANTLNQRALEYCRTVIKESPKTVMVKPEIVKSPQEMDIF